jgi:hypothetical protein
MISSVASLVSPMLAVVLGALASSSYTAFSTQGPSWRPLRQTRLSAK